jgi:glucose-6-phosphate dehydrogenase assembly protein OpcA
MQIQLGKTLDVEVVERQLAELWQQSAHQPDADVETAVLRARVANLLVYVSTDATLSDVHQLLSDVTSVHPSRVLAMLGLREATDRDIDMWVESICQTDKRSGNVRLSCEQITLKAQGKFVAELPSAALPLLAPDLSTFLWWRNALRVSDRLLDKLLRASDRLIVDSAEFSDPVNDLLEIHKLYSQADYRQVGVSDLNWARLTFWRDLLADFYDVSAYRLLLDAADSVRVDYVAPESAETAVAPQALFIAGWLASRLGWELADEQPNRKGDDQIAFSFTRGEGGSGDQIRVELTRVERGTRSPGKLVQVELRSSAAKAASFRVARSDDNFNLLAEARLGKDTHRGRVLPVRNRSTAQLLCREMEILCNDQMYQEAVAVVASMIAHSTSLS